MKASILRRAPYRGAAYTLFELMVVVTIIGAIAAIAIAPFARSMTIRRVEAAALRVAADLALARSHAMQTSATQTVSFVIPNRYTVSALSALERKDGAYVVDLVAEPYGVEMVSADFGGDGIVAFDGFGVPDDGGTVVVRSGSHFRRVTLDADGATTITEVTQIEVELEIGPLPN